MGDGTIGKRSHQPENDFSHRKRIGRKAQRHRNTSAAKAPNRDASEQYGYDRKMLSGKKQYHSETSSSSTDGCAQQERRTCVRVIEIEHNDCAKGSSLRRAKDCRVGQWVPR